VHTISLEHKCLVDLHIAALKLDALLRAERLLRLGEVKELLDVTHLAIAQWAVLVLVALTTNVIRVQAELLEAAKHLRPAVKCGGDTGEAAVVVVARLDEALAGRRLAAKAGTFLAFWVKDVEGAVASKVWDGRHLGLGLRKPVCEDYAGKVDHLEVRRNCCGLNFKVVLVNDSCNIGRVVSAVALGRDVDRFPRVLWEPLVKEEQKCEYVLSCRRTVVDAAAAAPVREADIYRLVKVDIVKVRVPAVRIWLGPPAFSCKTWAKLHEQPGARTAPRATIKPEQQWRILWVIARLKEPEEEVPVVRDVEVARPLLDVVADLRARQLALLIKGHAQLVVGQRRSRRVSNALVQVLALLDKLATVFGPLFHGLLAGSKNVVASRNHRLAAMLKDARDLLGIPEAETSEHRIRCNGGECSMQVAHPWRRYGDHGRRKESSSL